MNILHKLVAAQKARFSKMVKPTWWEQPLRAVTDLHLQLAMREVMGARDVLSVGLRFKVALLESEEWETYQSRFPAKEISRRLGLSDYKDQVRDLGEGKRLPDERLLTDIASRLDVPLEWLLSGDPKPRSLAEIYNAALTHHKAYLAGNSVPEEWVRAVTWNLPTLQGNTRADSKATVELLVPEILQLMRSIDQRIPVGDGKGPIVAMNVARPSFEGVYQKLLDALRRAFAPPVPPKGRRKGQQRRRHKDSAGE